MTPFTYSRATDSAAAIHDAAQAGAKYLGGGTNLVDLMREGIEELLAPAEAEPPRLAGAIAKLREYQLAVRAAWVSGAPPRARAGGVRQPALKVETPPPDDGGAPADRTEADHVIRWRETGELVIAAASASAFQQIASARILPPTIRAYPALVNGVLYARNDNTLVALDLR